MRLLSDVYVAALITTGCQHCAHIGDAHALVNTLLIMREAIKYNTNLRVAFH